MIRPLRTMYDFLALAAANAPTAAAARACRDGNFTPVKRLTLPNGFNGWRFTVISQRKVRWLITVEVREEERRYQVVWRKL